MGWVVCSGVEWWAHVVLGGGGGGGRMGVGKGRSGPRGFWEMGEGWNGGEWGGSGAPSYPHLPPTLPPSCSSYPYPFAPLSLPLPPPLHSLLPALSAALPCPLPAPSPCPAPCPSPCPAPFPAREITLHCLPDDSPLSWVQKKNKGPRCLRFGIWEKILLQKPKGHGACDLGFGKR